MREIQRPQDERLLWCFLLMMKILFVCLFALSFCLLLLFLWALRCGGQMVGLMKRSWVCEEGDKRKKEGRERER